MSLLPRWLGTGYRFSKEIKGFSIKSTITTDVSFMSRKLCETKFVGYIRVEISYVTAPSYLTK